MNERSSYRVLLIGVDAYPVKPLHGCVNDIDAVARLLHERLEIPATAVKRLVSPHPGAGRGAALSEAPATLANIRAALAELGSESVAKDDRVLIYYAGHGTLARVRCAGEIHHREALVPVDFNEEPGNPRLLFDFEVNQLIDAVVRRAGSVCLILDACHSSGATREPPGRPERRSRAIDLRDDAGWQEALQLSAEQERWLGRTERGIEAGVDACQIVTACLGHQVAAEDVTSAGVAHGLLTQALLATLASVDTAELGFVPWGRIWSRVCAVVESASPLQQPWLSGSYDRAVIAGPAREARAGASLIEDAGAAPLRCAVVPPDEGLIAQLSTSSLLSVVAEEHAEACLWQLPDGEWRVAGDIDPAKPGYPALITLRPDQLGAARAVLEQYHAYARPLRMAARCTDLPGALKITLLACPEDGLLEDEAAHAILTEMPAHRALSYALRIDEPFCVHVRNTSAEPLRVTMVNCAASGKVELLGCERIEPRSCHRFWNGFTGSPLSACEVRGNRRYIDRMVALGTTLLDRDFSYLRSDSRFSEVIDSRGLPRDRDISPSGPPPVKWTAAQVTLGIGMTENG